MEIKKITYDSSKINNKLQKLENKIDNIVSNTKKNIYDETNSNSNNNETTIKRKIWKLLLRQNELLLTSNIYNIKDELGNICDQLISLINVHNTPNNIKMWKLLLEQIDIIDNNYTKGIYGENNIQRLQKIYHELVNLSNL